MHPMHISRTVGRGVVEVAYGEKILGMIGDELLSWNSEEMHLFEENCVKFWFVDIFNFRSSMFPCLSVCSLLMSSRHSPLHSELGSWSRIQVQMIYQWHGSYR